MARALTLLDMLMLAEERPDITRSLLSNEWQPTPDQRDRQPPVGERRRHRKDRFLPYYGGARGMDRPRGTGRNSDDPRNI